MAEVVDQGGERILLCEAHGPPIESDRSAIDLIGGALAAGATMIAVPVSRLSADFFQLRSGVAGEIAGKVVTYRLKLAVLGDIAAHLAASGALRAWVRESNRHGEIVFLPSLDALAMRLSGTDPPG